MTILFWFSVATIAYIYFGYPFLLKNHFLGSAKTWRRGDAQPTVSFIVAAHNEESVIEAKIENLLASDYPRERVEILIGSDGSSDGTEEIVRRFGDDGVGLISFPQHQGKSAIQNGLVAAASGEILVFTDADCMLPAQGLSHLIENFGDERIGLVTGSPRYHNELETDVTQNESLYLRYETWLRKQENDRGLLAMASGSLFALRRSLWKPLDPNWSDDFALPLQVELAGMKTVLDSRVVPLTRLTQSLPGSMFNLKVRIVSKDFKTLLAHGILLNPFRYGAIAVTLWSHKLLRWLVPYFLLATIASNIFLWRSSFYRAALIVQMTLYAVALAGFLWRPRRIGFPFSILTSFCLVNIASLLGTAKAFLRKTSGKWEPVRKQSSQPR
jgi:cellulose synthase/poly-beta-1,6-N-acetylglucosamine synthase-like glycosyltransferase